MIKKKKIYNIYLLLIYTLTSILNLYNKNETIIKKKKTHNIINSYKIFIKQIENNITKKWKKNESQINKYNYYIKYNNKKITRTLINFNKKKIIIETIKNNKTKKKLKNELLNIIFLNIKKNFFSLFKKNKKKNKILITKNIILNKKNILTNNKKKIKKIIKNILIKKTKIRKFNNKIIFFLKINLLNNIKNKKIKKYINIINNASIKYNIKYSLILSIIHIESNFNQYAISKSNALGLMQIKQYHAGRDVFKTKNIIKNKPKKNYLFNPKNNIDIGVAYLHILKNEYFKNILNKKTKKYIIISSYNGGINNTLKIFSNNNKKSIKIINNINPKKIYKLLIKKHTLLETKLYILKIKKILNKYKITKIK